MRTLPTVDNSKSVKLDPLLGVGTQLQIIEGPVTADDYDWYLVQAIGLPHHGWVAAADHDGEPWIEDSALASASASPFTAVEADLIAGLRSDAVVHCAPRRKDLPFEPRPASNAASTATPSRGSAHTVFVMHATPP